MMPSRLTSRSCLELEVFISKSLDSHTRAMSEGRLTLRDGRTLAWHEYGPVDGRPHLRFQGTPGSRYSRHPHEDSYDRHHVRVILFDRPGYGASSRLPGRGISAVADDAAELLDHLGLDVVHVAVEAEEARTRSRSRRVTPSACEP